MYIASAMDLNDAWADINSSNALLSPDSAPAFRPSSPTHAPPPSRSARVARDASSHDQPPLASQKTREEKEREERDKRQLHALQTLSKEVCALRRQMQSQADTSTVILYAGIAVVVILLIVVSRTQTKLHATTEALLYAASSCSPPPSVALL